MEPTSTHTLYNDQFELDPIAYGLTEAPTVAKDAEVPPPGFYLVQLTSAQVRTDRETKQPWLDGKGKKVFRINRIEIMDPTAYAGSHAIFQDIYQYGRPQMNWSVKPAVAYTDRPPVYQVVKLLSAIDASLVTGNLDENCDELERIIASRPIVAVKLGYECTDNTHAKNLMERGFEKNDAYKQSRLYTKHFRNVDNTYRTHTEGPSGTLVAAKLKIDDFIPSSRVSTLTLGPLKAR
jgi:hypothetical protein